MPGRKRISHKGKSAGADGGLGMSGSGGSGPTVADYPGPKVNANQMVEELERRDALVREAREKKGQGTASSGGQMCDPVDFAKGRGAPGAAEQQAPATEIKHQFSSFDDVSQKWLVVNFAHRDQRPKKDRPSLRFLGVFENAQDADDYIKEAAPQLVGCNMWKVELGKWLIVCKNMARQQDPEYTTNKIEHMKQLYAFDKVRRDADFNKNKEEQKQGAKDLSVDTKRLEAAGKRKKKLSSRLRALRAKAKGSGNPRQDERLNDVSTPGTSDVPTHLLRRKQDYVAVSWMRDITKVVNQGSDDPEPCCIVWRVFATYDMATEWVRGMGSRYIRDYDLEIVDNYEWLFPEDVDRDKIQEAYRNPEQNRIMLQRKAEADKVVEFEQWCKEKNLPVPATEVLADQIPTTGSSLLPDKEQDLTSDAPIKLLPKTFDVKIQTKHPETEEVKIMEQGPKDFAFLRRPVLEAEGDVVKVTGPGVIPPMSGLQYPKPPLDETIHAPEE